MTLTEEEANAIRSDCFAEDIPLPLNFARWSPSELSEYFEAGGDVTLGPPIPLRFLCLHGGGVNMEVMKYQLRKLQGSLGDHVTYDFLNGGREWEDQPDPMLKKMFKGPFFGWYGVENDGDPERGYFEKLVDPSVTFTYTHVEEALERVESHIQSNGPYDALLAFSQGAIVATMLTALALEKHRAGQAQPPSWRHNILVSGMAPRDNAYLRLFTPPAPPLNFSCTLVFGRKDPFYEYGGRLRSIYASPTVFEHDEGHKFPNDKEVNDSIAKHVKHCLHVQQAQPP